MIRLLLTSYKHAYGYDVTGWEDKISSSGLYNSLLEEDLIERTNDGDILMYVDCSESAKDWCKNNGYAYELVKNDDN